MPWPQTKDQGRQFVLYEHTARTSCSGAAASLSSSGRSLGGEEKDHSTVGLVTENVRYEFVYPSREMSLILLSEGAYAGCIYPLQISHLTGTSGRPYIRQSAG